MTRLFLCATFVCLALVHLCVAQTTEPAASACGDGVFLTLESGRIAGVDWVERKGNQLHSRVILTQSRIIDASIELRPDETAAHSSVVLQVAGGDPGSPIARDLGAGATYWSDMIVSSVEQVVRRARVLGSAVNEVATQNLYRDSPNDVEVERVDATDWVVTANKKRYLVLTDQRGCMLAASLPEYGVVIERREKFAPEQYPLWPPYSAPPDRAYRAEDVHIPSPAGHVLAGTLTIPRNGQKIPAAVLITGLSPSERNGGLPPWMPLRDLADALTRAGIAVLRVDDRGMGKSTGDHKPSTTFDEADDVRTEVAWLRKRPDIDPKRVALVGYSEGGLIAPMVAADDPAIAAVVTLDGPGTSGQDLAHYQSANVVLHNPSIPPSDREAAIKKQFEEDMKDLTPREQTVLTIDPIPYAKKVRCPALIIHGGNDLTVPMRSAERIAAAMRANGNSDVTVRFVPNVSHSLLPDPIGLSSGWAYLPAFWTSGDVLQILSQWTGERLRPH
jgi:pimeloyl-ACP methyl ester carboxylesterase